MLNLIVLVLFATTEYTLEDPGFTTNTPWYLDYHGAISITCDEGIFTQATSLAPLLERYNYRATFFLVPEKIQTVGPNSWTTWQSIVARQHEIGSYTYSKVDFMQVDANTVLQQLKDSKDTLQAKLGTDVISFAYPIDTTTAIIEFAVKQHYLCARLYDDNAINTYNITNYYQLDAFHIRNNTSLDQVKAIIYNVSVSQGWAVFKIVGYGQNGAFPVPEEFMEGVLGNIRDNNPALWVAPFGQVVAYRKMHEATAYTVRRNEPLLIEIVINDTIGIDNRLKKYPYSLKTVVPLKWANAQATQNNQILKGRFSVVNGIPQYVYECYLDKGPITIQRAEVSIDQDMEFYCSAPYPNPVTSIATIRYNAKLSSDLIWEIFDLRGRNVATIKPTNTPKDDIDYLTWKPDNLAGGVYYYRIRTQNQTQEGKILFLK